MSYPSTSSGSSTSRPANFASSQPAAGMASLQSHHRPTRHNWTAQLSRDLHNFVLQLLPTAEEMAVKEDVRKLLERLIRTIEPESRLLSFGSTANGFSLRNSDMDLCCLIDSNQPPLNASDLVTMVGDLLERETKFKVKTLPHARIPIVKLSLDPSPGLPYGISCDIGFENRLALENTRLLLSYASVDPPRIRTLVIFLKVWSKRRKINSPYSGTLSSYGYVLLVIYFLVHVKNPPVLPNLQQMPPLRPISHEDMHIGEHNIWFFDDIDLLKQRWQSSNTENVAEILIDFFKYFSRDFSYNTGVASIRSGLLKKSSKGWQNDFKDVKYKDLARDRNRLCIEDPFETDYNVARCVTKEGLYTIRGEFMRASRILSSRPERTIIALAQLCEERETEFVRPLAPQPFVPPRLAPIPAQTPYSVGSNSLRPASGVQDRLSPPPRIFEPPSSAGPSPTDVVNPHTTDPPEHMAPKRGKWTSPPPPDDPDHTSFENRLGLGLSLATSSTAAREAETSRGSSSSNSEVLTDDDVHDQADLESVGSVTSVDGQPAARPKRPLSFFGPADDEPGWLVVSTPKAANEPLHPRGRTPIRFGFPESGIGSPFAKQHTRQSIDTDSTSMRTNSPRRSSSGPPAPFGRWPALPTSTPLPPSPPEESTVATEVPPAERNSSGNETPNVTVFTDVVSTPSSKPSSIIRTPFPLYQQPLVAHLQYASHLSHPSDPSGALNNVFTTLHPTGVAGPHPSDSSNRRRSWQRVIDSGHRGNGHPGEERSPPVSPVSNRHATKSIITSLSSSYPPSHFTNASPTSPTTTFERRSSNVGSSPVDVYPPSRNPVSTQASSSPSGPDLGIPLAVSMEHLDLMDSKGQ